MNGPTPGRRTYLVLDSPETVTGRPPWGLTRAADRLGRTANAGVLANATADVMLVPGPAWILRPMLMNPRRVMASTGIDTVRPEEWNLAPNMVHRGFWKAPTDLVGMVTGPDLRLTATGALQRFTAAGDSVAQQLELDLVFFPKPVEATERIPLDRVAVGNKTWPLNSAFRVMFLCPPAILAGPADILTFYFGGQADVASPAGARRGEFALHITSTGIATLYEYTGLGPFNGWDLRMSFRWAAGGLLAGALHWIDIIPYGPGSIVFLGSGTDAVMSAWSTPAPQLAGVPGQAGWSYYKVNPRLTNVKGQLSVTGPGQIRLDLRRDYLLPVWIYNLRYPPRDENGFSGYLQDDPFHISSEPLPEGTFIELTPSLGNLTGYGSGDDGATAIVSALYDAATDDPLSIDVDTGKFLSAANQSRYYTRYGFQGSADGYSSPVLYGSRWEVEGSLVHRLGTTATGGNLRSMSITGPDLDPSHESASLEVEDLKDELSMLRSRGRVEARIIVEGFDAAHPDHVSHLFRGEIPQPRGKKVGRAKGPSMGGGGTAMLYPSPEWRTYHLSLVGRWARLAEATLKSAIDCSREWGEPTFGTALPRSMKVTTALRRLCVAGGFEVAALDIPNLPLRLGVPNHPEDLLIMPGDGVIPRAIMHLCRDYLSRYLVYDDNAIGSGATNVGMMRLLRNPKPTDAAIWNFVAGHPGAGKDPMHPGSYPAKTTFIEDGTYEEFVVAPEFNALTVTATGQMLPSGAGPDQLVRTFINRRSTDFTGKPPAVESLTNWDYLGRRIDAYHYDPLLTSPQLINLVGLNLIAYAGRGEFWCRFMAPLVLYTNLSDPYQINPRPLRLNDVVTVRGKKGIIRTCNPHQEDICQMAFYEVKLFPEE